MPSHFQREVILFGCLVLLFVLVCPYTPSPTTPMGKIKQVLIIPFALVIAVFTPWLTALAGTCSALFAALPCEARLRDLLCARLC